MYSFYMNINKFCVYYEGLQNGLTSPLQKHISQIVKAPPQEAQIIFIRIHSFWP